MRNALAIPATLVALLACGDPSARWEVGGIYSVSDGGEFRVAKVLAIDSDAVSVRIYRDAYAMRPQAVDPETLSLGSLEDPEGFGIGHIPLPYRDFALSFPVLLAVVGVSDDELEGYQYWKESGAGPIDLGAEPEDGHAGEVEP